MPDLRGVLIAIGVGLGVGLFLVGFWHWPLAVGGGAAIMLAGLALIGTLSVGRDPAEADAAWREAAPDLVDPPASPLPGVGPRAAGTAADGAEVPVPEPLGGDAAP